VRPFVWISPSTLFIANTATPEEGNSAAPMWVMQHFATLYNACSFQIDPDYVKERVVGLSRDVAETYVPVEISVAYGGQTPVPEAAPDDPRMDARAGGLAYGDQDSPLDPPSLPLLKPNQKGPKLCIHCANSVKLARQPLNRLPLSSLKMS
jgi:hypothetical protein